MLLPCNLIDFCLMILGTISIVSATDSVDGIDVKSHTDCKIVTLKQQCTSPQWTVIYPNSNDANQEIDISDLSRYKIDEEGLTIYDPKPLDSGKYKCDPESKGIYLHVNNNLNHENIDFWATPSPKSAWQYRSVTLTCRVDGTSRNVVSWTHYARNSHSLHKKSIAMGGRTNWASSADGNYDLLIKNAGVSDDGFYQCKAKKESKKALLTIKKVLVDTVITEYREKGKDVVLTCPDIEFGGENVTRTIWMDKLNDFNTLSNDKTYTIANVQENNYKNYYCLQETDKLSSLSQFELKEEIKKELRCPVNYASVEDTKKCFRLFTTKQTFMQAEKECIIDKGHLATPGRLANGQFKKDSINTLIKKIGVKAPTWVGMDKIGQYSKNNKKAYWRWSNGRVVEKFDDPDGEGDCAYIDTSGNLKRATCWETRDFMCEVKDLVYTEGLKQHNPCPTEWTHFFKGGFCYFEHPNRDNSEGAYQMCLKEDTTTRKVRVAMPKTKREYRNVAMMTAQKDGQFARYWIGMYHWRRTYFRDGTRHEKTADWEFEWAWPWRYHKPCVALTTMSTGGRNELRFFHCTEERWRFICQLPQTPFEAKKWKHPCGRTQATLEMTYNYNNQRHDADTDSLPWSIQVYNTNTKSFICGGVFISDVYILTAADCLHEKTNYPILKSFIRVYAGSEVHGFSDAVVVEPRDVYIHPYFQPTNPTDNNVAVLVLKESLHFGDTNIHPVCEPERGSLHYKICLLTSWNKVTEVSGAPTYYRLQYCSIEPKNLQDKNTYLSMDETCDSKNIEALSGNSLICAASKRSGRWEAVGIVQKERDQEKIKMTKVFKIINWLKEAPRFGKDAKFSHQRVCLGQRFEIPCPGRTISYKEHYLSRSDHRICPHETIKHQNQTCEWENANGVQYGCPHGFCNVTNTLTSNSCPNRPYLTIIYTCRLAGDWRFHMTNKKSGCLVDSNNKEVHQKYYTIRCGYDNDMLKIYRARYGARIFALKPVTKIITTCGPPYCYGYRDVTDLVNARCQGKIECDIKVKRSTMGGEVEDCEDREAPYFISLQYQCVKYVGYGGIINEGDRADLEDIGGQQMVRPSALLVAVSLAVALAWL